MSPLTAQNIIIWNGTKPDCVWYIMYRFRAAHRDWNEDNNPYYPHSTTVTLSSPYYPSRIGDDTVYGEHMRVTQYLEFEDGTERDLNYEEKGLYFLHVSVFSIFFCLLYVVYI